MGKRGVRCESAESHVTAPSTRRQPAWSIASPDWPFAGVCGAERPSVAYRGRLWRRSAVCGPDFILLR